MLAYFGLLLMAAIDGAGTAAAAAKAAGVPAN